MANILLFANTEWYLYNFRRSLAAALRARGHRVVLLSPPGPYGERLLDLGFHWIPAPMDRISLNPLRELALVRWLQRLLAQEEVTLIHTFTIKCVVYGELAARWAGVPWRVHAVTGLGYLFSSRNRQAALLRPPVKAALRLTMHRQGARVILQNPDDVDLFGRLRLADPTRVRLVRGSGVDCRRFSPTAARVPDGRFRVLLPARLLWDKGVGELVEAIGRLRVAGAPVDLWLAGVSDPGNPAGVPTALVQRWVGEGLCSWLGHVEEMPALYRSVDCVALPSYREGLPRGLIEAGACGLPLVTTDVPGCREVVVDGVDGLLVPARDAVSLAAALGRLAADPALCARLGAAAREKVLARFDERIVIDETLAVYRELLGRRHGRAGR